MTDDDEPTTERVRLLMGLPRWYTGGDGLEPGKWAWAANLNANDRSYWAWLQIRAVLPLDEDAMRRGNEPEPDDDAMELPCAACLAYGETGGCRPEARRLRDHWRDVELRALLARAESPRGYP